MNFTTTGYTFCGLLERMQIWDASKVDLVYTYYDIIRLNCWFSFTTSFVHMEIRLKTVWGLQSLDCKIMNFKNLHRLVLKLSQSQDFQKPWPLGRGHCDSNSRFLVDTPTVSNWNSYVTSFSSFTSPGVHARPAGGRQYPDTLLRLRGKKRSTYVLSAAGRHYLRTSPYSHKCFCLHLCETH